MHGLLSALGRGFKEWIGWKRVGIAASTSPGPTRAAHAGGPNGLEGTSFTSS